MKTSTIFKALIKMKPQISFNKIENLNIQSFKKNENLNIESFNKMKTSMILQ